MYSDVMVHLDWLSKGLFLGGGESGDWRGGDNIFHFGSRRVSKGRKRRKKRDNNRDIEIKGVVSK